MKFFDNDLLAKLYVDAAASPRLRSHFLLHASHADKVQRLLIAMVKGSYVEPHYHEFPQQWEMFVLLTGKVRVCLYAEDGVIFQEFILSAQDPLPFIELAPGDIHCVECLSHQALLLEVKEGPFDSKYAKVLVPLSK
ncbi:MAG: WbuC family cupin fold metalloprotein [Aeromonas popoffii]|jgi:cupin fold WbuC family metalloprotein|uniref:WbuC family cupin fold metalloprotein n=1 Tax=Aeromonas popoffii TaxID=70856 RepID=UPI003F412B40